MVKITKKIEKNEAMRVCVISVTLISVKKGHLVRRKAATITYEKKYCKNKLQVEILAMLQDFFCSSINLMGRKEEKFGPLVTPTCFERKATLSSLKRNFRKDQKFNPIPFEKLKKTVPVICKLFWLL